MTLIEVMLATAMLLGSVMVMSRMAFLAGEHARGAEDRSMSQTYCRNIMEEMLSGTRPLQNASPALLEDDAWVYMVKVEAIDEANLTQANLKEVAVTVARLDDPDSTLPKEDDLHGYRLVHWVRGDDAETAGQDLGGLGQVEAVESVAPVPAIDEGFRQRRVPQPRIGDGFQQRPSGGEVERGMEPEDMPPELW
ncbi:MAG: type IV pilus modification PilV family protein [Planctomycetota bacterium]